MIHSFLVVVFEFWMRLLLNLPRFRTCVWLKKQFLRLFGAKIGQNVVIYPGVWIATGRGLVIGNDVDLAVGVLITTHGGVTIGDRSLIGYRTSILSSNHSIPDGSTRIIDGGHVHLPVRIENDVWIGANCTILPGVTIGEGAVVGASSVVTKNVPAYSIVVGNPAKVVRNRLRNSLNDSNGVSSSP